MDITSIISGIPLFEGLSPKQCTALGAIAVRKYYSRGENFFAEGDDGIGFYIVLSGKVKVFKLSPEGKEQIFHILEAPEPFVAGSGAGLPRFVLEAIGFGDQPVFFQVCGWC